MSLLGTLERLFREVPRILAPLADQLDADGIEGLLLELGLRPPEALLDGLAADLTALRTALDALLDAGDGLEDAIASGQRAQIVAAATTVGDRAKDFLAAVRAFAGGLRAAAGTLPGLLQAQRAELEAFARGLPNRLLGRLLVQRLDQSASVAVSALLLLGVIDIVEEAGGPAGSLVSRHTRQELSVERLLRLFSDPLGLLREAYGWGTPSFDGAALFRNVNTVLVRLAELPSLPLASPPGLEALGFRLALDPGSSPPGLELSLRFPVDVDVDETIAEAGWTGRLRLKASFVRDLDASLRPPLEVELLTPGQPGEVSLSLDVQRAPDAGPFILGDVEGARLEVADLHLTLGLEARWAAGTGRVELQPTARAEIKGARLVASALGLDQRFDFGVTWSPGAGLAFDGGKLGPIAVERINLKTETAAGKTRVGVTADAAVTLGPLVLELEGGGVALEAGDAESSGPFGLGGLDVAWIRPRVRLRLEGDESPLPVGVSDLFISTECLALRFQEPAFGRWLGAISPALAAAAPSSAITLRATFAGASVSEVRFDWTVSGASRTLHLPFLEITTPDAAMATLLVGGAGRSLQQVALALTFPTGAELVAASSFAWDRGEDRGVENDEQREDPLLKLTVTARQVVSLVLVDLTLGESRLPRFFRQTAAPLAALDFTRPETLAQPTPFSLTGLDGGAVGVALAVDLDQAPFRFPFLQQGQGDTSQLIQVDRFRPEDLRIEFDQHRILLPIGVTVALGDKLRISSQLDLGFDWERVAFSVDDGVGLAFRSPQAQFEDEFLGLTFRLVGAPADASGRHHYFTLVTKDSDYQLQQAPGSTIVVAYDKASQEPIEFSVSQFSLTSGGLNLSATVGDAPVRLNGLDQKFRFTGGQLEIKENRLTDFSLSGSGDLPPDLVGPATADISLQFSQRQGAITLVAGQALLRGTSKLKCEGTRFQFQVDALGLKFVNDGRFHLYFTITGRARFVLAGGDDREGALAFLPNIQIDLVDCPLAGDASVIGRHVNFLVELPRPLSFNFLGAFEMELRGVGFQPQAQVFDGDGAMLVSGQLKFAQGAGDTPDPRTDLHKLYIGLPKKGTLVPRIHFEKLPVALNLGEAFRLNGVVDFKDGALEKGFTGEGSLQIQGLPTLAASFAFLRVRRDESSPWVRAWFIYLEVRKVSFLVPYVQIYIREVGLGFGYRFTLVSIAAADRQNDVKKLLAELKALSRTQGELSRRDRWALDLEQPGEDPRWTVVLRALFSQTSAAGSPLQWNEGAEKDLPCLYVADALIALRSDFTFFMSARAWIFANYHDLASNWENIRERPLLSGFVLLSPSKKRFLAHLASNPDGKLGRHPPLPEFVERALSKCQFSATLLIEPGLVHHELGWPNALVWKDKLGPLEIDNRGGLLLRITGTELVIGVSLLSRGRLAIAAEVNLGIVGARVSASAEVAFGLRFIGLFDFRDPLAGSVLYGGIGLEARVAFAIEFWIRIKLGFIKIQKTFRFSLTLGFTAGLEVAYANTSFGLRGQGTVSVSCMGRSVHLSARFGVSEGIVARAQERTRAILDLGLEATEVEPMPGIEAPAPGARRLRAVAARAARAPEPFAAPEYRIFSLPAAHRLPEEVTYFALLPRGEAERGFLVTPPGAASGPDYQVVFPADPVAGVTLERFDPLSGAWQPLGFSSAAGGTVSWRASWTAPVGVGERTPVNAAGEIEGEPAELPLTLASYLVHAFVTDGADAPLAVQDPAPLPATSDAADARVYDADDNAFEAAVRGAFEQFQGAPFFKRDRTSLYEVLLEGAFDDRTSVYTPGGQADPAAQGEQQAHELRGVIVHDMIADLRAYAESPSAPAGTTGTAQSVLFGSGLAFRARGGRPGWLDGQGPGLTLQQRRSPDEDVLGPARPAPAFNTTATSFATRPPEFRRLKALTEARTIALAWELAWSEPPAGSSGAAADPEHHLLHYEVRRRALDAAERELVYTVKAADVLHRVPAEAGAEDVLWRLRPRFQVVDHFGEETADDLAALPPAGRSYLYTVTPVDFAGARGRPVSLVATRRPADPPRVPVDAQATVAYAVSDATFAAPNLTSPSNPRLLLPSGLRLTFSDPATPPGAPLVPVHKTYLVFRRERTLPAGDYGLDGSTDRPRSAGLPTSNARRLPTDLVIEVEPSGSPRARQVLLSVEDLRRAGVFPPGSAPRWQPQAFRLFIQTESLGEVRSPLAPVGLVLRASSNGALGDEDPAAREERRPAELEWLPAPMRLDLLPAEDARAQTGAVHVPIPTDANQFRFDARFGDVVFQAHPAGHRVVRFRFNQAPSGARSYALELAAGYDLLELDVDGHSTATFASTEALAQALRPIGEVQIASEERLLLSPGDTLAPASWEAFYPSTSVRLASAGRRPQGAETRLAPWYSWRESYLDWPAWPGLTSAPFVRDRELHPALALVLERLGRLPPELVSGTIRGWQVDRPAAPPGQPGDLAAWLAATAPDADPYGWGVLQRLGLSVTFSLRDPDSGKVLAGPQLVAQLAAVLQHLDDSDGWAEAGVPAARQHLFVEALYRPGARVELAAGGRAGADRLLGLIQLSLRPRPIPYLHYRAIRVSGPARARATLTLQVPRGQTVWIVNQTEPAGELVVDAADADAIRELTCPLGLDGRLEVLLRGTGDPARPAVVLADSKTSQPISDFTVSDAAFDGRDGRALYFSAPAEAVAARVQRPGDPLEGAWQRMRRHLEGLSSTDPAVADDRKIQLPTGTELAAALPDLFAWTQRFFDASDPVDPGVAEGPFLATAYPRAHSPSFAGPDADGRLPHDHLLEDPWGHAYRYYVRPRARYDRLWRSLQQSPSLFPGQRAPWPLALPRPQDPALDVVLERIRAVVPPLVLGSSRLDGQSVPGQASPPGAIWEVLVAQHPEQVLIERNQPLARQLAFRGVAFTLVRRFAHADWADWLGELGGVSLSLEVPENVPGTAPGQVPPPPTALAGGPDHLDPAGLDEDGRRSLDLPLRLGAFGQGAMALQWEALPFFYEHRLLLVAQTTQVVSAINEITQKDFRYLTPAPEGARRGLVWTWTPSGSFSGPALPVPAIGVTLPLRRLWEALPPEAQAQWPDEAPSPDVIRPGWLPDLGVVYQVLEAFLGNVETQGEVFFDPGEGARRFDRRQLGSHFLVDVGALQGTTDPQERFRLALGVLPVSEQTLSRVYGEADRQGIADPTRRKVAFQGRTLRFVGPPDAADRAALAAALDAADQGAVALIAAGFVTEEAVSRAPAGVPAQRGEIDFPDPRALWLTWEGPLSDPEAAALAALPADPELARALGQLAAQARVAAPGALTAVAAPLGADQAPRALAARLTLTTDGPGTHYTALGWSGPLLDEELAGLEGWAQIQALRLAVDDLRRQADAARFSLPLPPADPAATPPRPRPQDLPAALAGQLTLEPERLEWRGRLHDGNQRLALEGLRGDPPFQAAVRQILSALDAQSLSAPFRSPVRPAQEALGALGDKLLLGRVLLRHRGLLGHGEALALRELFPLAVDRRAVARAYQRSQENPLRERLLLLRARRGAAAASDPVELHLDPLSAE